MKGSSGMRTVGTGQGAGRRGEGGWGKESDGDRVAADAVDCVSRAYAGAASESFGEQSDAKEATIAGNNRGADE